MALNMVDENGNKVGEITKEQFMADWQAMQAKARAKAAEEEHMRILREEASRESARANKRTKPASDSKIGLMNALVQIANECGVAYRKESDGQIFFRMEDADYEVKITKKKQRVV